MGHRILPVTPIYPAIQVGASPSGPFSTTQNIHTERGWLNAVDPGYAALFGGANVPQDSRAPRNAEITPMASQDTALSRRALR